jgi:cytochrome c556
MQIRHGSALMMALGALLIGSGMAAAAAPAISAAIANRQANYKEIGGGFKAINDEIKTGSPDMNSLRPLARDIAARAAATLKYFPRGSGPESGIKTRAKPEIWKNQAEFVDIQQKMIAAANSLNSAAAAGNLADLTMARNALGGTCRTCHDRFRVPE